MMVKFRIGFLVFAWKRNPQLNPVKPMSSDARLDEARERLGLKTRMDLFRKSLADYLTAAGEHEVAQLFTEQA